MKKLTTLMLCLALMLSLAACASDPAPSETPNAAQQPSSAPAEGASAPGKALVVYFSASGNTARVAKDIADAAGADLFELVPTEAYSTDDLNWRDSGSRVNREHDDESLRDIALESTEAPDWD